MTTKYILILLGAAFLAALVQCSKSSSPSIPKPKTDPSFSGDIQPIFSGSCATSSACHQSPGQMGLILSSGQSYALLVNFNSVEVPALKRVRPSKVDSSYVAMKLDGAPGIVLSRMPPGGALASDRIQMIKNWISKGALDN